MKGKSRKSPVGPSETEGMAVGSRTPGASSSALRSIMTAGLAVSGRLLGLTKVRLTRGRFFSNYLQVHLLVEWQGRPFILEGLATRRHRPPLVLGLKNAAGWLTPVQAMLMSGSRVRTAKTEMAAGIRAADVVGEDALKRGGAKSIPIGRRTRDQAAIVFNKSLDLWWGNLDPLRTSGMPKTAIILQLAERVF